MTLMIPSGTEDPQVLSRIEELLRLQALEDRVSRISVWPFETKVVKRLVAIKTHPGSTSRSH